MSGLFTAESRTGRSVQESQIFNVILIILFCALCPTSIFNSQTKEITVGSHNLHSFKTSVDYHKSCLKSRGGIWLAQELWLTEKQLPLLHQLNANFTARSGMEEAVSSGVLRGRPHGGVSIAWSPDLDHVISPLSNYKHKRVVAAELATADRNVIFISVYMPFMDSSNRATCVAEYTDAVSMVELIVSDHPHHLFVLGGDLNCELTGDSPFDDVWRDFVTQNQFAYCNIASPPGYTYHHATLGHKKMNDHFLVSNELMSNDKCTTLAILDEGENPSDHLPITMVMSIEIQPDQIDNKRTITPPSLKWDKVSPHHIQAYSDSLSLELGAQSWLPVDSCEGCHCDRQECRDVLQQNYDRVISSVCAAEAVLPRYGPGVEKDWWNPKLTELKQKSIEIHNLWVIEGRPRSGPIYSERLRVRAAYKRDIRAAQIAPKQRAWNRLHSDLEFSETIDFWKTWKSLYSKSKNSFASVVNGCSSRESIANEFKKVFLENSKPNNQQKVDELNRKFVAQYGDFTASHSSSCDCDSYQISLPNLIDAICCMKKGKCADADGLMPEHFHNAPLILLEILRSMFNRMLQHSFVPNQFRFGFMVPIIKDPQGNHSDSANYRGITISPIISKVFEHALKIIFTNHLSTSPYQFGFKQNSSTVHSLYCLQETIDYFVNNNSRVFCSFLDASKAFDRLIHSGLFIKLMNKKVPKIFLDIMMTWHTGLQCRVKWDGFYSDWFHISAGVRQGGVLSPDLYCIYVDDLINILQSLHVGCYVKNVFAAALFYADDMAVLAPSLKGLQKLLDACASYCAEWDIKLNAKKTKNICFGKGKAPTYRLKLNGSEIDWEDECVYLGVTLKSGAAYGCSMKNTLGKFYRSLNSIIRVEGRSDDMVMLRLLESHSLPILSYAIETVHVSNRDDNRQLRVAYNAIYRKMFGYSYRESVTALQHALDRPTWEELVEARKGKFIQRCRRYSSHALIRIFVHQRGGGGPSARVH